MAEAALENNQENRKLDDVMLAMDVVDTLRHDQQMLEYDLSQPDREQNLLKRLREIYNSQGIEVPDRILLEGVQALEDERFAYNPYKGGFLAKAYINRGRWGKPLLALCALIAFAGAFYYGGVVYPQKAEIRNIRHDLQVLRPKALKLASRAEIKNKIDALYQDGMMAVENAKADKARKIDKILKTLTQDLSASYTVRIISRPGENSGVFRLNDKSLGAKNYYLIVEAVSSDGDTMAVNITSEEDQHTSRVKKWGVRVPHSVYLEVAADKSDDQIIQNAIIGTKKRGVLEPEYTIQTSGGLITEW